MAPLRAPVCVPRALSSRNSSNTAVFRARCIYGYYVRVQWRPGYGGIRGVPEVDSFAGAEGLLGGGVFV